MQSRKLSCKISLTKNLTNQQVKDICSLKNKHWKFGFKSQIEWFKLNSFANQIRKMDFIEDILFKLLEARCQLRLQLTS